MKFVIQKPTAGRTYSRHRHRVEIADDNNVIVWKQRLPVRMQKSIAKTPKKMFILQNKRRRNMAEIWKKVRNNNAGKHEK